MDDILRDKLLHILHRTVCRLPCDRALVACGGEGFAHGLPADAISTTASILQSALEGGEAGLTTSGILSALTAVLYVPIRDPLGRLVGIVYADSRVQASGFRESEVWRVQQIVRDCLIGLEPELEEATEMDWEAFRAVSWN